MLEDQDIICCHSACNSDFPLICIGEVYYCPQVLVLQEKNNMSNDQEVSQNKLNTVLKAEIGSAEAQW